MRSACPRWKTRPGATRAIAPLRRQDASREGTKKAPASSSTSRIDPLASLEDMQKVKLLERLEQLCARAIARHSGHGDLGAEYEVVLVARSDGVQAADVRRSCGSRCR